MPPSRHSLLRSLVVAPQVVALFAITTVATNANAALTYTLAFNDPLSQGMPYYSDINSNVHAALNQWGSFLAGSADLSIQVNITDAVERASGRSFTSAYLRNNGSFNIYEQGVAEELRTGIDPNGDAPDIELQLNPTYLANELWFDPNPELRNATVDTNRTDAMSVFIHELGHAIAFNGWGHLETGAIPADYVSTWDDLVVYDGSNTFFSGLSAENLYGGPIPITNNNNFHIGNLDNPGADLVSDLMNGVIFNRGQRYSVSNLDLAIISDLGVALVPEPSTYSLMLTGFMTIGCLTFKKRKRSTH
ncbi:MAG: PEP-CTERM sorting domain-containing protein [Pseudomonadota bacterium]